MKKIFILSLLANIFLFSCKKDTPLNPATQDQQTNSTTGKQVVNPGDIVFPICDDWRIALFQEQEENNTNKYNQFTFKFCPENTVVMYNDIMAINGNWYFMLDKGNPTHLTLDFSMEGMPEWTELEGTWGMAKFEQDAIQLQSEDGSVLLTFERK